MSDTKYDQIQQQHTGKGELALIVKDINIKRGTKSLIAWRRGEFLRVNIAGNHTRKKEKTHSNGIKGEF